MQGAHYVLRQSQCQIIQLKHFHYNFLGKIEAIFVVQQLEAFANTYKLALYCKTVEIHWCKNGGVDRIQGPPLLEMTLSYSAS